MMRAISEAVGCHASWSLVYFIVVVLIGVFAQALISKEGWLLTTLNPRKSASHGFGRASRGTVILPAGRLFILPAAIAAYESGRSSFNAPVGGAFHALNINPTPYETTNHDDP